MTQQHDFSKGSVARNILYLAAPMTAAQLINVLYSVVDRMYLGRLPGHLALTGVGLTLPVVSIIMGFANLCGTGGAPLCSICRGRGDDEEAERIMGNSFTLLLLFGAAVTVVFLAFQRPILYLFGASDATYPYASAYMTIYLLGSIFVMIGLGMNPFISMQGFGRTGMMTVGLGALVNIVLDPVFIFGLNMGVRGALLSPVIILGGIYSGIFTPTEAACVSVVYSIFASVFIYKEMGKKELFQTFLAASVLNGVTSFLLGYSTVFSTFMTFEQVPQMISHFLTTVSENPIIILLLINAILLVIGLFLDTVPAIIVMAPLLLPTVQTLGIDPIQFGVIMSVNLAIGLCSPPYGCNLFVGAAVAKIKMESMFKWIVPYFILSIIALMLITFVEPLSMFLVG